MIVLDQAAVRERIDVDAARAAVRDAFVAHARAAATLPGVMHLDLGPERGDLHVKGAWLHNAPTFAIKVAGAFAGAVAVDRLAPPTVDRLAVLGTGGQARFQLEAISRVRPLGSVAVWGRRPEAARAVAVYAHDVLGLSAEAVEDAENAVHGADVVVTVTASRTPLFAAAAVAPATLVVAVGADTPGKQELDPQLLARAALVVGDDLAQCGEQGELQHAPGGVTPVPLGALLGDRTTVAAPRGLTVVDLTGLGVQDAAVADIVVRAELRR